MDEAIGRLRGPWANASIALTLAAGLTHVFALEEHLQEWWAYATFFLFASAAQIFYGLLLGLQPWRSAGPAGPPRDPVGNTRIFLWAGIVGNLLMIILYAYSRIVGVPAGPEAGTREPVTVLGIIAKAAEIALVYCLWRLLRAEAARDAPSSTHIHAAR